MNTASFNQVVQNVSRFVCRKVWFLPPNIGVKPKWFPQTMSGKMSSKINAKLPKSGPHCNCNSKGHLPEALCSNIIPGGMVAPHQSRWRLVASRQTQVPCPVVWPAFQTSSPCFRTEFSLQARRLTLRIRLGKRQWRLWTMQAVLCKRVLQGLRTWQRAENQREIVFFALVQTFQQRKPWAIARRSWKASWMLPNFSEMLRASPCQAQAKCSQPRRSLVHLFIHSLHNSMQIFRNRRHQFISLYHHFSHENCSLYLYHFLMGY